MPNKWDDLAALIQSANRSSSARNVDEYTTPEVRQAIVHAREDVTLIAVHASSLNAQIASVRTLLALILAVLIFIAARPYF
jgi:hypothetical protein